MKIYHKIKEFQYLLKENKQKTKNKTKQTQTTQKNDYIRHFLSPTLSKHIKERDQKQCFICGNTNNIEAHHIFGVRQYPFLAVYPENVITLCTNCHEEYHTKYTEINALTWSQFLKNHKITEYIEIYPTKEQLINNDPKGTILHIIRHEKNKKINHGKLLAVMQTKYNIPYYTTETLIKELLNKKTIKDRGGEYSMK